MASARAITMMGFIKAIAEVSCLGGLLAMWLMVHAANAAEWYVNNSSVTCRDHPQAGTESAPWCRISFAASRAQPSDIIYVKNGVYRETLYIAGLSGGSRYITIQEYPGHSPVIRGEGFEGGRNKIVNSNFLKIAGFTITGFQQGLFVEGSNNIILERLKVHDVGQEAVHIKVNSSFVTLKDSTISDTGKLQRYGEGVYIGTSSSQQPTSPPYDNTHDILVKGNTIYNTTDECIEAKEGTYNVTIDGNIMRDCLLDPKIIQPGYGSIELMEHRKYYNADPAHVVKNNIIQTTKTGIGVHTGATVFNNVIYGQIGDFRGISIDNPDADGYARRVYHNTIVLPDKRAVVSARGAGVDIRNNIGPISANNIASQDVLFVSKALGDFRLMAGSAAIHTGVDVTGVAPQDIVGAGRSVNPGPSMGAYEFR